jgi:hypothetical protein
MGIFTERAILNKEAWIRISCDEVYIRNKTEAIDHELIQYGNVKETFCRKDFVDARAYIATVEALRMEYTKAGWTVNVRYIRIGYADIEIN